MLIISVFTSTTSLTADGLRPTRYPVWGVPRLDLRQCCLLRRYKDNTLTKTRKIYCPLALVEILWAASEFLGYRTYILRLDTARQARLKSRVYNIVKWNIGMEIIILFTMSITTIMTVDGQIIDLPYETPRMGRPPSRPTSLLLFP